MAFSATRMLMAAGSSSVAPPGYNASDFSNAGTYLLSSNGIAADSSTGTLSFWINYSSTHSGNLAFIHNNGPIASPFAVYVVGTTWFLILADSTNTNNVVATFVMSPSIGVWYNVQVSWNTNFALGSRIFTCAINNTIHTFGADGGAGGAFNVNYTANSGLTQLLGTSQYSGTIANACFSEVYFAPGQFLDFTVSGNRALFNTGGSTPSPVSLGSDGSTPTGTAPAYYFRGLYNSLSNPGSVGGSFTVTSGPITACGSVP